MKKTTENGEERTIDINAKMYWDIWDEKAYTNIENCLISPPNERNVTSLIDYFWDVCGRYIKTIPVVYLFLHSHNRQAVICPLRCPLKRFHCYFNILTVAGKCFLKNLMSMNTRSYRCSQFVEWSFLTLCVYFVYITFSRRPNWTWFRRERVQVPKSS